MPGSRGGGLEDVSFGDIMEHGLIGLARSSFRGSAQFQSRPAALASPSVDVVVVPTGRSLRHAAGPGGPRSQGDHDGANAMARVGQGGPGAVVEHGGHAASRDLRGPPVSQGVRRARRARAFRGEQEPRCDRFRGGSVRGERTGFVAGLPGDEKGRRPDFSLLGPAWLRAGLGMLVPLGAPVAVGSCARAGGRSPGSWGRSSWSSRRGSPSRRPTSATGSPTWRHWPLPTSTAIA
jgi:hypothetical protein